MNFKKHLLIYNARLITKDKIINKAWVLIKAGRIKKCGRGKNIPKVRADKINARNHYLSPGFIDLHIHGNIEVISKTQSKYGTTAFLHCLSADRIDRILRKIKKEKQLKLQASPCLGFYLEGPFLSQNMAGGQPRRFIIEPDKHKLGCLLKTTAKDIKIITLAPEQKGAFRLIKILNKNHIITSLGHSNASFATVRKAVDMGACYATHGFNRMSGLTARNPGLITAMLIDDRITTEVIADGHHVHPALLKLLVKNKPLDKIILVTDSVAAEDKRTQKLKAGVYRLKDATISGSNLTMITAIKNMVELGGVDIKSAVTMAALNPAKTIGLSRRKGSIAKGKDADIVIFDKDFKVRMTIISGNIVWNKLVN